MQLDYRNTKIDRHSEHQESIISIDAIGTQTAFAKKLEKSAVIMHWRGNKNRKTFMKIFC